MILKCTSVLFCACEHGCDGTCLMRNDIVISRQIALNNVQRQMRRNLQPGFLLLKAPFVLTHPSTQCFVLHLQGLMSEKQKIFVQENWNVMYCKVTSSNEVWKLKRMKKQKKCGFCGVRYTFQHNTQSCWQRQVFTGQFCGKTFNKVPQHMLFVTPRKNKSMKKKTFVVYDIESHSQGWPELDCTYQTPQLLCFTAVNKDCEFDKVMFEYLYSHTDTCLMNADKEEIGMFINAEGKCCVREFLLMIFTSIAEIKGHSFVTVAYNGSKYDELFLEREKLVILKESPDKLQHTFQQAHGKITNATIFHCETKSELICRDIIKFMPALSGGVSLRNVCIKLNLDVRKASCDYKRIDQILAGENMSALCDPVTGFLKKSSLSEDVNDSDYDWASNHFGSDLMRYLRYYCAVDVTCVVHIMKWLFEMIKQCIVDSKNVPESYKKVVTHPSDLLYFVTLAQYAFANFESFCCDENMIMSAPILDAERDIRKAIVGGRVQSNMYGKDLQDRDFSVVDIVSQYPNALNMPLPKGSLRYASNEDKANLSSDLLSGAFAYLLRDPFVGCFKVTKTDMTAYDCGSSHDVGLYGAIAVKCKTCLNWPSQGEYIVWLSSVAVHNALVNKWEVFLCHNTPLYLYDGWSLKIGEFFQYWFQLKLHAKNETERIFAKILMNSIYGKLIQNSLYPTFTYEDGELLKETKTDHDESNRKPIGLGLFCLDNSKMIFADMLQKVLSCRGRIYYCDTDSIMTDWAAVQLWKKKWPVYFDKPSKLGGMFEENGKMKLTYSVTKEGCACHDGKYDRFIVLARKMYYLSQSACGEKKVGARGHPRDIDLTYFTRALQGEKVKTYRGSIKTVMFHKNKDKRFTAESVVLSRTVQVVHPANVKRCEKCNFCFSEEIEVE